jgi:hypothetical protein
MDLYQRGELGPANRSASNALGEQWSFAAVVITAIMLPCRRCLFEGHPVLGDELHERLRGVRDDAVRVFTMHVIDPLDAQGPDHLYPCSAIRREGVGGGHHAAQLWRRRFCDVMLDHKSLTNHLHVDRHAGAIVGDGCSAADVVGRTTALIFSFRKVEEPFSNVDFFNRYGDDMAEGG